MKGAAPEAKGTWQCRGGAGHALGSEVREFAWKQRGKGHWAVTWVLALALKEWEVIRGFWTESDMV